MLKENIRQHECSQRDKIDKILDRVNTLEISNGKTDVLINQFTKTIDKLSDTLDDVKSTMIGIHHAIESNDKEIKNINIKIDEIKSNEDKNKIDMRDILRSSFIKGGVGFVSAYAIYEVITKLMN